MNKIKILIIMMFFLLPFNAQAATYYVDGTLSDDCDGTNYYYNIDNRSRVSGSGQIAWNDLASANSTLIAGDTVYIRGEAVDYQEYAVGNIIDGPEGICPDNSGTSDNYITYSVYPGEKVHLVGDTDTQSHLCIGIWINQKNYIKVTGVSDYNLKVSKMSHNICIGNRSGHTASNSSSYNEICYVLATNTFRTADWRAFFQANAIWKGSQYNHIHHCKFSYHGYLTELASGNEGDIIWIGTETSNDYQDYYNIIEDCEFACAGHSTFGLHSAKYTVVRNNYIHNEEWFEYSGSFYSYRNIISAGYYGNAGWNVFENNRIGYAGPNICAGKGGVGAKWCLSDSIIRCNSFFGNTSVAFGFYPGYANTKSNENYFYNNTFYHNGYNNNSMTILFAYNNGGILWDVVHSNVLKNNLFYDNYNNSVGKAVYDVGSPHGYGNMEDCQACGENQGCNTIENNFNDWDNSDGDPLFTNPDLTDPPSLILPDFSLQFSSSAINQGTYLTQAVGAGSSSTTLIVDDAHYFQDGKFGSASGCDPTKWPPNVDIQADWIAIGTLSNIVQISSINYESNTITLATPTTWDDNANIWLEKKSDGERVRYGTAPDMGAHEFVYIMPPTKLLIVK